MAASKHAGWGARGISGVERDVAEFLADEARHGGIFVKSRRVADEFDISTNRAAQALAKLAEEASTLSVERWSAPETSPATWHVEHDGPSPFGVECRDCGTLVDDAGDDCPHCGTEVSR